MLLEVDQHQHNSYGVSPCRFPPATSPSTFVIRPVLLPSRVSPAKRAQMPQLETIEATLQKVQRELEREREARVEAEKRFDEVCAKRRKLEEYNTDEGNVCFTDKSDDDVKQKDISNAVLTIQQVPVVPSEPLVHQLATGRFRHICRHVEDGVRCRGVAVRQPDLPEITYCKKHGGGHFCTHTTPDGTKCQRTAASKKQKFCHGHGYAAKCLFCLDWEASAESKFCVKCEQTRQVRRAKRCTDGGSMHQDEHSRCMLCDYNKATECVLNRHTHPVACQWCAKDYHDHLHRKRVSERRGRWDAKFAPLSCLR